MTGPSSKDRTLTRLPRLLLISSGVQACLLIFLLWPVPRLWRLALSGIPVISGIIAKRGVLQRKQWAWRVGIFHCIALVVAGLASGQVWAAIVMLGMGLYGLATLLNPATRDHLAGTAPSGLPQTPVDAKAGPGAGQGVPKTRKVPSGPPQTSVGAEASLGADLGVLAMIAKVRALKAAGDYETAAAIYQLMILPAAKELGEDNPIYATCVGNLAVLYDEMGKHTEAEPFYRQALDLYRKTPLGDLNPPFATTLFKLGQLYEAVDDDAKAEECYQQVLGIERQTIGEADPSFATSLMALAGLYYRQGKHTAAEPLYVQALAIRRDALDKGHPTVNHMMVAETLNNLAGVYRALGRADEAEKHLLEALEIQEK